MTKKGTTVGLIAVIALGVMGIVGFAFAAAIEKAQQEIIRQSQTLEEYRELMKRKTSFESEWAVKKNNFNPGIPADEVLNAWQKTLMSYAQAEALAIDKLEPAGTKGGEATVFLSFQGDMKKLVRFVYRLMDSEPLARVKSFSLRQEDGAKNFSFEMMLGKGV